jgi:hypothetical protein
VAKRLRILLFACLLTIGMSGVPAGASYSSGDRSDSVSSETAGQYKQSKKCKKLKKKAKKSKKARKKYEKKCRKKSGGTGGGGTGGGGTGGGGGGGTPATCPAYVPGEEGAEAETSVVTDTATEAAPVEVTISTAAAVEGEPAASSKTYHNIQVNSAAASTGLWVRFEMDVGEDYDIYLNNPDGSEAAHASGYNPAPAGPLDGTGSGGHSEQTAEQLDGVSTPDCGGYTLDMTSFQTPGGDKTLKLWLGEANCTPPCGGPAEI